MNAPSAVRVEEIKDLVISSFGLAMSLSQKSLLPLASTVDKEALSWMVLLALYTDMSSYLY